MRVVVMAVVEVVMEEMAVEVVWEAAGVIMMRVVVIEVVVVAGVAVSKEMVMVLELTMVTAAGTR